MNKSTLPLFLLSFVTAASADNLVYCPPTLTCPDTVVSHCELGDFGDIWKLLDYYPIVAAQYALSNAQDNGIQGATCAYSLQPSDPDATQFDIQSLSTGLRAAIKSIPNSWQAAPQGGSAQYVCTTMEYPELCPFSMQSNQ